MPRYKYIYNGGEFDSVRALCLCQNLNNYLVGQGIKNGTVKKVEGKPKSRKVRNKKYYERNKDKWSKYLRKEGEPRKIRNDKGQRHNSKNRTKEEIIELDEIKKNEENAFEEKMA
jgi:hypothetical protein